MNLDDITEVQGAINEEGANFLLQEGWVLLRVDHVSERTPVPESDAVRKYGAGARGQVVYEEFSYTLYTLGKPREQAK